MNFIKTSDADTAKQLIALGFQQIQENNGLYTFLNNANVVFSNDIDKKKLVYNNQLCV